METKRACNKEPAKKKEVKEKESTHSIESTPHTPVESHKSQSPDKTKVSPRKSKRNEKSSESNLEEEYKVQFPFLPHSLVLLQSDNISKAVRLDRYLSIFDRQSSETHSMLLANSSILFTLLLPYT